MSSYYRIQLEEWLKTLDVKAESVLDIGGSQLPVRDRVKSWDVHEYHVFDLPTPHKGATPNFSGDLNDKDAHCSIGSRKFDTAFCLEVAEYIFDPRAMISNIQQMLRPGGTLYITFPYYYPPHEPHEEDYLRYTLAGARKLLSTGGFSVDEVIPRKSRGLGLLDAISENALRLSKRVGGADANVLGFIIKATRI